MACCHVCCNRRQRQRQRAHSLLRLTRYLGTLFLSVGGVLAGPLPFHVLLTAPWTPFARDAVHSVNLTAIPQLAQCTLRMGPPNVFWLGGSMSQFDTMSVLERTLSNKAWLNALKPHKESIYTIAPADRPALFAEIKRLGLKKQAFPEVQTRHNKNRKSAATFRRDGDVDVA